MEGGRPTSGSSRTDLLTTVLALDLFMTPARTHALVEYWLNAVVPAPANLTPVQTFAQVMRTLVEGTRECALHLTVANCGPDRPLDFTILLFPRHYNMGINRAFSMRLWAHRTIAALALLLDPRGHDADLSPPFLGIRERGTTGDLVVDHFTGNALLHYLCPAPYFVTLACAAFARMLCDEKIQPALLAEGGAMLNAFAYSTTAALLELADVAPDHVAVVLRQCADAFRTHLQHGAAGLGVLANEHFPVMVAAMDRHVSEVARATYQLVKECGRVPRLVPRFDPNWRATALPRELSWLAPRAPPEAHLAATTTSPPAASSATPLPPRH